MNRVLSLFCFFCLLSLLSCYPSYTISSGRVLPENESTLNVNYSSPNSISGLGFRSGIGNGKEGYIQATVGFWEIGVRKSHFKSTSLIQSSFGLNYGQSFFKYERENNSDEIFYSDINPEPKYRLRLLRTPLIISFGDKNNRVQLFGHAAPSFAWNYLHNKIGLSMSCGLNFKIYNQFGLTISPFMHMPLGRGNAGDDLFGYPEETFFLLYNYGVMFGINIGEF